MKRLFALLMLLFIPLAHAETPPVMLLPQGHICLASEPVGPNAEHRLLALAEPEANAVKLAMAARGEDGIYRVEALSRMIITLHDWNPDAVWMQDKWQDGRPYFWWGAGEPDTTEEFYLMFGQNADGVWMVTSGYDTFNITGNTYHFTYDEPGFIQVSGETVSPAILWPTELSMQLEGFCLYEFDQVCGPALRYLDSFSLTHTVDEQDETYRIIW